jgi:hypothetical protein
MKMDSTLLKSCDPIGTYEDAKLPVITPLLPVNGLRRDDKGELTDDAITTVMQGLKSLGIQTDDDSTRDAVLEEARSTLCRLNAQIQFLLNTYLTEVARSEQIDPMLMTLIKEKNRAMQDILSVSRQVIVLHPFKPIGDFVEGFIGNTATTRAKAILEEFQDVDSTVSSRQQILEKSNLGQLAARSVEDSETKNNFAARQLELYAFLNIVAIGLLFYIYTAK